MMQGIILAAGIGSRLRPLTDGKPKCLINVASKPILDYQLAAYEAAGIPQVTVIVGYHADAVRSFIRQRENKIAVEVIENTAFDSTNNMVSLYLARAALQGRPFILSNGDVALDAEIMRRLALAPDGYSYISVDTRGYMEESMKIRVDENGVLCGIAKSISAEHSAGISIDVYRFTATASAALFTDITRQIEQEKKLTDWTEVSIARLLAAPGHDVKAFDIGEANWVEVDNLDDLAIGDAMFSSFEKIAPAIRCAVFDIDGTVMLGDTLLPGAIELVAALQARGVKTFFCTNNSSCSRVEFKQSLMANGIPPEACHVLSSIDTTLHYLTTRRIKKIFLLGTPALAEEFTQEGFILDDFAPEYIVVGFDRTLNYERLALATQLIAKGTPYLLTHPDEFCPTPNGPIPDAGAICALLYTATKIAPLAVLGKPHPMLLQIAMKEAGVTPAETLMIGDRLSTDIAMAHAAACYSALVLSGATTRAEVEAGNIQPTLTVKSVAELICYFER